MFPSQPRIALMVAAAGGFGYGALWYLQYLLPPHYTTLHFGLDLGDLLNRNGNLDVILL